MNKVAYLPEDCSGCGVCGEPILGSGWCSRCYERCDALTRKARGLPLKARVR